MVKNDFDLAFLRARIIQKFGTLQKFAKEIGISVVSLSKKLHNVVPFTSDEIYTCSELLGIQNEIEKYFFTLEVK